MLAVLSVLARRVYSAQVPFEEDEVIIVDVW